MNRLDRAIEAFGDETSDLTLGERVSLLRQALLWNAYETIQKIHKYGKKHRISEEEEYIHVECMNQFKVIERMYASEVKANKLMGKSEEKMNADLLETVKKMKNSVGDIIAKIPLNGNGHLQN